MKRILLFVVAFAAVSVFSAIKPIQWDRSEEIEQGAKLVKLELDEPRLMKVFIVRIDMKNKNVKVTGTPRADKWGEPMPDVTNRVVKIHTKRERTADFMVETRKSVKDGGRGLPLFLAVNSIPWEPWEPPYNHKYAYSYRFTISDGMNISGHESGKCPLFVVWKDGRVDIVSSLSKEEVKDVWLAHPGFSIVLADGVKKALPKATALAPRMAYGLSKDRRYLYLLAVDGRQRGYSLGANMNDLADILFAAGASEGINMDGGGSTTLVYWDREKASPVVVNSHGAGGYTRPVAANIGFYLCSDK